jgi:branched-chain amino acid transport system substrate-binding protein
MRRSATRVLAAAAACAALSACAGPPFLGGEGGPGAPPGPVTVALVDAFSGSSPYAAVGPALQNAAQLQVDALNAQGGLLGAQLRLVTADDQLSPAATPGAVKQVLANRSVRLVIGPSLAGLYLGARPLVEQARVPNCLTNMAADDLMQGTRYTFRASAPAHANVPSLLGYAQRGTQLKKIGLIAQGDGSGQEYDRELSDQAPRFGLQYLGAAFVAPVGDQRTQVQQMLKQGVDAVVLSGDPATAAGTLQAITALKAGARLRALGFGGLGGYSFVQQSGDAANGVVFTSTIETYLSDVPDARWPPAYRDFVKKAQARFGPAANGVELKAVPAAADCVAEWARAVSAAGTFDGSRVAAAWQSLDVPAAESVLGVRERFTADDHDALPPDGLHVYQWAKGGGGWGLKQLAAPGG